MYHAKDGLYFKRLPDGSVKILVKRKLPGWWEGGAPVDESPIEVTLDSLTWASAVASVSKRGDVTEVFEEALRLHDCPIRIPYNCPIRIPSMRWR